MCQMQCMAHCFCIIEGNQNLVGSDQQPGHLKMEKVTEIGVHSLLQLKWYRALKQVTHMLFVFFCKITFIDVQESFLRDLKIPTRNLELEQGLALIVRPVNGCCLENTIISSPSLQLLQLSVCLGGRSVLLMPGRIF